MKTWKLLQSPPAGGIENMETDRRIFKNFIPGKSLPVLRIYSWRPAAISVGRFQKAEKVVDLAACREGGVDVVKRITGGGAIYHYDEITYSITCSRSRITPGSVKDGYYRLCSFIAAAYRKLGLNTRFGFQESKNCRRPAGFCFAGREEYDIVIDGVKIGGNAQKRSGDTLFQHGSIPFTYEPERLRKYFKVPVASPRQVCTLRDCSNVGKEKFRKILRESFSEEMNASLKKTDAPAVVA